MSIYGWAAQSKGSKLVPFEYDPGPLAAEDVELAVEHCGICHSDLSVIQDNWGFGAFPVVPGHEVIGRITAVGSAARGLKVGQRVGVGWNSASCMHCRQCLNGKHQLCSEAAPTIVGHYGGFADRMRAHWAWTIPLPDGIDPSAAGPLLCGGITVFNPFYSFGVKPTAHVGVVGIGGLGHMALKFAAAWGCEVTAFTSSQSKADEARSFGAHHIIATRDADALQKAANTLDLLLVTVNVPLDWLTMIALLKPEGRMHVVGAVLEPIPVPALSLIMGQRSVSGSPTGSPTDIAAMLQFAARHGIAPQVEHFPLAKVNEALEHLIAGKARYRIVLDIA